jgi:hypothetical protein
MEYEFLFVVDGVSIDDDDVVATISEEFDGLLSWHRGLHRLAVAAEGGSAMEALHGLLPRLATKVPALRLLRLDPDLVGTSDIADRVNRTRQNVQQWVDGDRNSGSPFPQPEGAVGRSLVWRWSEVNEWLRPLGLDDGESRATRDESLFIDLVLLQWQQALAKGLPLLKFVAANDDRAADRHEVMTKLNQVVGDPQFLADLVSWPRGNTHQLTVVCAVLLDPLKFVLEQMGSEPSGVLAVMTEDNRLHITPIASVKLPWTAPISELGLSGHATVGDLILAQLQGVVSPAKPLALTWT